MIPGGFQSGFTSAAGRPYNRDPMKPPKKKRPYKPPTMRSEKIYERKSLACGKASGMTFACMSNPKLS